MMYDIVQDGTISLVLLLDMDWKANFKLSMYDKNTKGRKCSSVFFIIEKSPTHFCLYLLFCMIHSLDKEKEEARIYCFKVFLSYCKLFEKLQILDTYLFR